MSTAKLKSAVIGALTVLAVVYVLNQTPAKPYVQKALVG